MKFPIKVHRRLGAAFAAALVAAAVTPAAADAGSYTVHSCQDAAGGAASAEPWGFEFAQPSLSLSDDSCPRGGRHVGLRVAVAHPGDASARMSFLAPADTSIVHYRLWRSARVNPETGYFFSALERFGADWRWAGTGCNGASGCRGVGDPAKPLSDANRWERRPVTPVSGISLYVSCGYSNYAARTCEVARGVAAETWLHRAEVTLADDVAPTFDTAPTGALVSSPTPVTGVVPVSLQASDRGGGLTQAQVEVDGSIVASQALGGEAACTEPYKAPVPCQLQASATVSFDTSAIPDGTHTVRVLLRDAGGNVTPWGPVSLRTANAPPDLSCVPEPVVATGLTLTAGLVAPTAKRGRANRPRARVTLRHSSRKQATFRGRLLGTDGKPVAQAPLCVVWRTEGETGGHQTLARLSTDADGQFSTTVPHGSSRDLWAIYRVANGAVTAKATVRVVPRLVVRPSRRSLRNGQTLVLRGRLVSGPIPSRGVLVLAEAWRGTHWQPFGEVRARGRAGRFRIPYRFTGTTGVQTYSLRVRVVEQAAYPYTGVASRAIRVRVSG